jgi:hypothetical protein
MNDGAEFPVIHGTSGVSRVQRGEYTGGNVEGHLVGQWLARRA